MRHSDLDRDNAEYKYNLQFGEQVLSSPDHRSGSAFLTQLTLPQFEPQREVSPSQEAQHHSQQDDISIRKLKKLVPAFDGI